MRGVSAAMSTWLAGDVRTIATCVQVIRTDATVWGFTDHDVDIAYSGVVYRSTYGYTASAIESSADLSTSNLEIDGLLVTGGGAVTRSGVEAGLWSNAAVLIFVVNYADLSMGQMNLTSGNLGQFTLQNGVWKAELRGLAQTMQQTIGEQFSTTCRATFGDSRCQKALGPLTFSGSVSAVTAQYLAWTDPSLTQAGPTVSFVDSMGRRVPTTGPFQIQIVPPSGTFVANSSVADSAGNTWTAVGGSPSSHQYSVTSGGLYTFNAGDGGAEVFINYTYGVGYFAYGKVTWTSGQNTGYSMEVRNSSPGSVTLAMPMTFAIASGDAYTIVAGCDKQFGTCRDRWSNILHFRGEPYIPGPDTILRPLGD
ncbi:Uncharacterized conserved protein [Burkholderia pseudomallei]|nr:Uncharacterized conserved protein [Burkholderia pseudomallei]